MKIVNEDGTVRYYYYKKKKGRKKKRGPKKKPLPKIKNYKSWDFKIVKCRFNKQVEYIGKYRTLEDVYAVIQKIKDKNATVKFPLMYCNSSKKDGIVEDKTEYLILRVKKDGFQSGTIENEYGKTVQISTNSEKWGVYDRIKCLQEETFWVYGHNPISDRKDVTWIMENIIHEMSEGSVMLKLYVYNKRVLILNDNEDSNIITCKNKKDALRLCDYITANNEYCYMTITDVDVDYKTKQKVIKIILDKTGWKAKKIWR